MRGEDFQHEVLFEESTTTVRGQSLFVGRAFGRRRFLVAILVPVFVLSGLIFRAGWMQIVQGAEYQGKAEANRLREQSILPRRGIIRDRQGRVLADNVPRFQVTMTPLELPHAQEEMDAALGRAARVLGLSIVDLQTLAAVTSTARDETYAIAEQVPYEQAMAFAIALPELPGFDLQVAARRRYPFSGEIPSLSHVLGYVGKLSPEELENNRAAGYVHADEIGKTGLERSYESLLRGTKGSRTSEVDARGRIKALVGESAPVDGTDVRLSLDLDLQRISERALRDALTSAKVARGAVVAMDPRDGSVLALVSWPAYDDNNFSGGVSSTIYKALIENPDQPLFPRAWAGTYPSGSTVKIVVAAAALAEHVITPATTIFSSGGIRVGPWFFPDWKAGGHGAVNVRGAIAWSVNTFFYTIGGGYESLVGLGVDRLTDWYRRFGLGSKTGIDVPGEGTGFVPSRKWKEETKGERWFVGDTYNLSIGQGDLLVTPVQVAAYTSAIANGGFKVIPRLEIPDAAPTSTQSGEPIAAADVIATVRQGMRENVTYGSGRALADMPVAVSGKTGTAQWHSEKNFHAWFTAYAPSDKPEIVVTVLLEEGGEGSSVSVPVARKVLQAWWDLRRNRNGAF
ncbi:penicillin-binding protein 2 [Candidatus Uhrbacteria bacterium]|nr:penicillin-binding protein 2 [Candidatus Uhrbacteria bacterium]